MHSVVQLISEIPASLERESLLERASLDSQEIIPSMHSVLGRA
jgi:hypothetical protein